MLTHVNQTSPAHVLSQTLQVHQPQWRGRRLPTGNIFVIQVYAVGSEAGYNLMIMDLLSRSTEDLFVERNKRFSAKTVLMLG